MENAKCLVRVSCIVEDCIFNDSAYSSCKKNEIEIYPRKVTINYPVSACKSYEKIKREE